MDSTGTIEAHSDYVFDNIGNRNIVTNNSEATVYGVNSLNQYTNIVDGATNSPTYDSDGNMLSNGDWTYTWNGENRLISASNASTVVSFGYDYMGRCYDKVKDGNAVDYIWDGYNIISEISSSQTNYNIWGLDLSGSMQGAGGVGGLLAVAQDGNIYFTAYDANGNITSYADTNETIVAGRIYSPFGRTISLAGSKKDDFTHWWSTKPWDADTEMSEYEYRKLLVEMGRFANHDPLGEDESDNLYSFALNDPIELIDTDGRWIWPFKRDPEKKKKKAKKKCDKWIEEELNDMDWIDDLPDCPNKLTKCGDEWDKPEGDWSSPHAASPKFHPGADTCVRSTNNKGGPGQQCCYDSDGGLLSYNPDGKPNPGAGTPDERAPEGPIDTIGHYIKDVKMFNYCVKNLGDQWIVDEYMRV